MKLTHAQTNLLGLHIMAAIETVAEASHLKYKQRLQYVWQRFLQEKDGAKLAGNKRKHFTDWLSGLPSALPIEAYNSDIFEVGKAIGCLSNSSSDQEVEDFVDNWFKNISDTFINMLYE